MLKVDLHTHSIASPDGSIHPDEYRRIIESGVLDCIAVTDHNRIDFAQKLQAELGSDKIIVGEEISTRQGDIIGLFLAERIQPNQDIEAAIAAIKNQGGVVYIPHPFETVRSGIKREDLERIIQDIDIIESANGRAYFQNFGPQVHAWARLRNIPSFASSDAHRANALGKTYSLLSNIPTADNLRDDVLKARKFYIRPSILDILAPKMNRLKKRLRIM
ncbi:PHP domain-containing protein [Candidatus Saccharibacteria bacterium]|nr:PHP domain-containing protein [Candidatus Saccharibacteria bacterium]